MAAAFFHFPAWARAFEVVGVRYSNLLPTPFPRAHVKLPSSLTGEPCRSTVIVKVSLITLLPVHYRLRRLSRSRSWREASCKRSRTRSASSKQPQFREILPDGQMFLWPKR